MGKSDGKSMFIKDARGKQWNVTLGDDFPIGIWNVTKGAYEAYSGSLDVKTTKSYKIHVTVGPHIIQVKVNDSHVLASRWDAQPPFRVGMFAQRTGFTLKKLTFNKSRLPDDFPNYLRRSKGGGFPGKTVPTALNASKIIRHKRITKPDSSNVAEGFDDLVKAQPKLLRISARCDGSGRIIFTRGRVHYKHKHWARPTKVMFDGEPWRRLDRTPAPWRDFAARVDLTKAWIVSRKGRDVIALENTPDGFDLYLCDSPNGAADYTVTIAFPRRK